MGKAGTIIGKGGKLLSAFGRCAGPLLAPLGIVGGIHDMFSPDHEGWRGVGDRFAGGLGVVGAAGKWVGDTSGKAWNGAASAVGNVVDGAKNFLSNPVKSLGGLFA